MRILLPFAIAFSTSLCAQNSFAPVGAKWTYTQRHFGGPDTNLFVLECTGDTLIQGRTCSKLAITQGLNNCMPFFPALTRQGDSILVYQPIFSNFGTLYVFGQAPGSQWETIIDYPFGADTVRWTVLDTGHVVLDGVSLLSQEVSAISNGPYQTESLTSGTMIDRLGDLFFLFPWILGFCDAERNGPLRCYSDPEINWLAPHLPQCDLSTGITERSDAPSIMVSPSILDAGGSVHVALPSGSTGVLLDATGRTVAALPANGDLNIAHTGLYLIHAVSEHGQLSVARVLVR
jgi:hypothetical protein